MPGRNLVLIGFMGTGKSTVGRQCATRLGMRFRDTDQQIERQAGMSVAELFRTQGEATFRERERAVIAELASASGLVIATGGGAVLNPENVELLRAGGLVVLLHATPEVIMCRVGRVQTRPLLAQCEDPQARVENLLAERADRYRAAAHCQVDTVDRSVRLVVDDVIALYRMTAR